MFVSAEGRLHTKLLESAPKTQEEGYVPARDEALFSVLESSS